MSAKSTLPALFEAIQAPVLAERKPLVKAKGNGATRLLRTESGKVISHGDLIRGLLKREHIEIEVQEGKRPTGGICDCGRPFRIGARGSIPKTCKRCRPHARTRDVGDRGLRLKGQSFGDYLVKERCGKDAHNRKMWLLECSTCGATKQAAATHITHRQVSPNCPHASGDDSLQTAIDATNRVGLSEAARRTGLSRITIRRILDGKSAMAAKLSLFARVMSGVERVRERS